MKPCVYMYIYMYMETIRKPTNMMALVVECNIRSDIPNTAIVTYTSTVPQNGIGNY